MSKAAYKELALKHSTLKDECKNLKSHARLKSKELQLLKKDANAVKETIGMLQRTIRFLKLYNKMNEK